MLTKHYHNFTLVSLLLGFQERSPTLNKAESRNLHQLAATGNLNALNLHSDLSQAAVFT